jgi:probable F420-dependent oxidoreductase
VVEMEIGVHIPHMGPLASPAFVPAFCERAEEVGFDGLWTAEHLAVPEQMESVYPLPRRPVVAESEALRERMGLNLEMITTLAVAAAVTSTVRVGTSVVVLPLRNPLLNARQLASIDLYSSGRLVCGVGVGWLEEEAAAVGVPWDRRGARAEEHMALLRAVWGAKGDTVSFEGDFYSFANIAPDPRPGRSIPLLIGGHSRIAIERAARVGDGWIASGMSPDRLGPALDELQEACARRQRDADDLWIVCGSHLSLDMEGGLGAVEEQLGRYESLGVDHLKVRVTQTSEGAVLDELGAWGKELLGK